MTNFDVWFPTVLLKYLPSSRLLLFIECIRVWRLERFPMCRPSGYDVLSLVSGDILSSNNPASLAEDMPKCFVKWGQRGKQSTQQIYYKIVFVICKIAVWINPQGSLSGKNVWKVGGEVYVKTIKCFYRTLVVLPASLVVLTPPHISIRKRTPNSGKE